MLEVKRDKVADAVYVKFKDEPVERSEVLDKNRILDYAADGSLVGVDLLNISQGVDYTGLPHAEEIKIAVEEHNGNNADSV